MQDTEFDHAFVAAAFDQAALVGWRDLSLAEAGRAAGLPLDRVRARFPGRGALLLVAGTFNLTMWLFGALLALFGFLSSIKATTERTTAWWLRRSKALRLKRQMAAQAALASMPVQG